MINNFKVGDIITAYHTGIHKVTHIEDRTFNNINNQQTIVKIIHYLKIADNSGIPRSKKGKRIFNSCNVSFCTLLTVDVINNKYLEEMKAATIKRDNTLALLDISENE